jgi:hypothetical protein
MRIGIPKAFRRREKVVPEEPYSGSRLEQVVIRQKDIASAERQASFPNNG